MNHIDRRRLLAGAAGLSFAAGARRFARAAGGPQALKFAYQPGFAYGLFYVAQSKGWFKDVGVSLDPMTIFTSGPIEIDAVIAGDLDAGVLGFVPILTRAAGGQPVRIIDVVDNSGRTYAVVGTNTIDGVPGLKGKTVGVTIGSNYDYFLAQVLDKYNIAPSDLHLVNFGDPVKAQAAFLAGQVDAIVPITTNRDAILQQKSDAKVIFSATQFTDGPNPSKSPFAIYDLFATTKNSIAQNGDAYGRILEVFHTKVRDYVTSPSTQGSAVDDLYDWQIKVVKAEVTKDQIAANLKGFDFYSADQAKQIVAGGELKSFLDGISTYLIANKLLDKKPDLDALIDAGPANAMK